VFAGATLPFGLAKAVADSVNDNAGGYASDGGPSKCAIILRDGVYETCKNIATDNDV
jgi:hypothetical protein